MPRKLPIVVEELLEKSKQSALLAVELYNKPTIDFRVQSFVMLMHTAWNALFLAYFHNKGVKPFYKEDNDYFYVKVYGEKKAWDLSKCMSEYWEEKDNATRQNLQFFNELRHKIQHYRDQKKLSKITFGECQSYVTNFERILVKEFGEDHSLAEKLTLSIQLSSFKSEEREEAIMEATDKDTKRITDFIKDFRSSLSDDIYSDLNYSHKLFLLPKTANHQSRESIAVEWVPIEEYDEEERKKIDQVNAIIKRKQVQAKNPGNLKPSDVCDEIKSRLDIDIFSASWHHAQCWRHFEVRPATDAEDPYDCNTKYCQYDPVHEDYIYTEEWVDFLEEKLSDEDLYQEIMQSE